MTRVSSWKIDWNILSPKMSHRWRKELWTNGAKLFGKKVFQQNVSGKVAFSTDKEQKQHHLRVFENVSPRPLPYLKFFFLKHWVKGKKVLVEVSILKFFLITEAIFSVCPKFSKQVCTGDFLFIFNRFSRLIYISPIQEVLGNIFHRRRIHTKIL